MLQAKTVYFLLGLMSMFLSLNATAQRINTLGRVVDVNNGSPIAAASVLNVLVGNTALSRKDGTFQIEIGLQDILIVSASGFYSDTLRVNDSLMASQSLFVRMRPLPNTLPVAYVSANYNPYQVDSIQRRIEYNQLIGDYRMPAVGRANNMGFGVGINLDRFGKGQKNKRKAQDMFHLSEQEAYINFRWNEEVVKVYTNFNDEALYEFLETYRPDYEWLRANPTEPDLVYHINKSLKLYKRRNKEKS